MTPTQAPRSTKRSEPTLHLFFTEAQVARLSRLSLSTIRSWERKGIVTLVPRPESALGPHSRLYDYFSVVTFRLLAKLRRELRVPLKEIRKTADWLRSFGEEPWSRTIYVLNRRVLFERPGSDYLTRHTGQRTYLDLSVIEKETRNDIKAMLERPAETIGQVTRQRNVLGNAATIAGTRIRTSSILAFHKAGYSTEQIIGEYPDLTPADIAIAIAYEQQSDVSAA